MKQVIFRTAAGLLAIGSVVAWINSDNIKDLSLLRQFGIWMVTISFAAYAVIGQRAADGFLGLILGSRRDDNL